VAGYNRAAMSLHQVHAVLVRYLSRQLHDIETAHIPVVEILALILRPSSTKMPVDCYITRRRQCPCELLGRRVQ
jgi:hypothetical protein